MIYIIIQFVFAIIIHELAHYLIARYYNIKPNIRFKWTSIEVESVEFNLLKPKQFRNILIGGILTGLIFVPFNSIAYIVYTIACASDISNIQMLEQHINSNKNIHQINKDEMFKTEKEINRFHNAIRQEKYTK